MVPLTGNITLGVGALSYAGTLSLAVVADVDTCRDLDVFVDAAMASLHQLDLAPVVGG